jgi:branched-subunit amino acid ABC-type transport system permease component
VLIYKATETVSFAQGDLMMLGAFLGLGRHRPLHGLAVLAAVVLRCQSPWRAFGMLARARRDPAHPGAAGSSPS